MYALLPVAALLHSCLTTVCDIGRFVPARQLTRQPGSEMSRLQISPSPQMDTEMEVQMEVQLLPLALLLFNVVLLF